VLKSVKKLHSTSTDSISLSHSLPAFPKSPFERELQRLLNESAKNKMQQSGAVNKTNNLDATKKNGNNNSIIYAKTKANAGSLPSSSLGNNNNNNNIKAKDTSDDSCVDTNSLKHPVGLDAIKEMTRNKNPENLR
jgi:hypothetical protein